MLRNGKGIYKYHTLTFLLANAVSRGGGGGSESQTVLPLSRADP
jgi:hypothetical protein